MLEMFIRVSGKCRLNYLAKTETNKKYTETHQTTLINVKDFW